MTEFKRPMLAINMQDVSQQPTYQAMSEKLDGVRVIFIDGAAYSRSMKKLPNQMLQELASKYADVLQYADGEVIAGPKHAIDVLQRSTSFCTNKSKEDDFKVYLFDRYHPTSPWYLRYNSLFREEFPERVEVLEHFYREGYSGIHWQVLPLRTVDLDDFEQDVLSKDGKGVIVRDLNAKYKQGKSGKKFPELQKVKRFDDAEFVVVGYNQLESNQNEATTNELGYTKRSTSKDGKVLLDALGGLVLALPDGRTFNAGSGFTAEERKALWLDKETLLGKLAKIKFFGYSYEGVPLLPTFVAFRDSIDT